MAAISAFLERHATVLVLIIALVAVTALGSLIGGTEAKTSLTEMLIRAVIVIGLSVFIGNSGVISFGHIAFCCIGAYAAAWVDAAPSFKQIMLPALPEFLKTSQEGFAPALLAAGAFAALAALILGLVIMRLSGIAASIATFAFLVIINSVYSNADALTGGLSSIIGIPTVVGPWTACFAAIVALLVAYLFRTSRYGLMLQATRDDRIAAMAAGINIARVRLIAFVLSAAIVGVAGGIYAHFLGILTVDAFYLDLAFITLAMLVVGGMDHLASAVTGVLVLTFVIEGLRLLERGAPVLGTVVKLPDGAQEIGLGLILALTLIFSPRGLAPRIFRRWWSMAPAKRPQVH